MKLDVFQVILRWLKKIEVKKMISPFISHEVRPFDHLEGGITPGIGDLYILTMVNHISKAWGPILQVQVIWEIYPQRLGYSPFPLVYNEAIL